MNLKDKQATSPPSNEMNTKLIPPKYLSMFLVMPILLHLLFPIQMMVSFPYTFFGLILILFGLVLYIWSVIELKRNDTEVDFYETASKFVINGPFRFSRNPIYLGGVILSVGIAIFLGSLITFIFPVALILIFNNYYIPFEELELEKTFSEEYRNYKKRVRRWI